MNGDIEVEFKFSGVKCLAYQIIEKTVHPMNKSNKSGRVYVPKEWIGRKVKILLLEPASEEQNKEE